MKRMRLVTFIAIGLILAGLAAVPLARVHAQCGPNQDQPCAPDEKKKKPTPTDLPTPVPTGTVVAAAPANGVGGPVANLPGAGDSSGNTGPVSGGNTWIFA